MVALTTLLALSSPAPIPARAEGLQRLNGEPFVAEWQKHKASVLIFTSTDCPIANRYAPELQRLQKGYDKKGVQFLMIYIVPAEQSAEAKTHAEEFKLTAPAILDTRQAWVKATGVRVTPEVAVIAPDGTLKYRGRIDSRHVEHGRERANYRRDLQVALDEILSGKPVSEPETSAMGCFIMPLGAQRS